MKSVVVWWRGLNLDRHFTSFGKDISLLSISLIVSSFLLGYVLIFLRCRLLLLLLLLFRLLSDEPKPKKLVIVSSFCFDSFYLYMIFLLNLYIHFIIYYSRIELSFLLFFSFLFFFLVVVMHLILLLYYQVRYFDLVSSVRRSPSTRLRRSKKKI